MRVLETIEKVLFLSPAFRPLRETAPFFVEWIFAGIGIDSIQFVGGDVVITKRNTVAVADELDLGTVHAVKFERHASLSLAVRHMDRLHDDRQTNIQHFEGSDKDIAPEIGPEVLPHCKGDHSLLKVHLASDSLVLL